MLYLAVMLGNFMLTLLGARQGCKC
jgi:hypothetical protein